MKNKQTRKQVPNYEKTNEILRIMYAKDEKLTETSKTPVDNSFSYPRTNNTDDDAVR